VLLTLSIFNAMSSLGWWTQWLLIAAFWWIVFAHRHEVLAYARLGHTETGERGLRLVGGLLATRQLTRTAADATAPVRRVATRTARTSGRAAHETRERLRTDRAHAREQRENQALHRTAGRPREQVERSLDVERRAAESHAASSATIEADIARLERRRRRIAGEIVAARSTGDTRRAARLADRDLRLRHRAAAQRAGLERAESLLRRSGEHRHTTGSAHGAREIGDLADLLDREAAKRRGVPPGPRADADAYRDYARLASLAGLSTDRYLTLPPAQQRRARLTIDRKLEGRGTADVPQSEGPSLFRASGVDGEAWERAPARIARRGPESASERRRRQLATGRGYGPR
jgi:hypothetical protein